MKTKTHLGAIACGVLWGSARIIAERSQVSTETLLYVWMFAGFLMGIIIIKTWD